MTLTPYNQRHNPLLNPSNAEADRANNDKNYTRMKTIASLSGGKTSAFIAANYPSDYLLFALVRIEDENCRFKDEKIRRLVEDKIQAPFIATSEDDMIIYTMLDLEQYLGKEINWVTGITFDEVIEKKGGFLPSKLRRFCTTHMKIIPIFEWVMKNIGEPVNMQIGFRANELERANGVSKRYNKNGFIEQPMIIGKLKDGRNKWKNVEWARHSYPLIEDGIYKDTILNFWKDKAVRFAPHNNCIGCFHRNIPFLRFMYQEHPHKMAWFEKYDGGKKGYWLEKNGKVVPYKRIKLMLPNMTLFDTDFTSCDAGYCGM